MVVNAESYTLSDWQLDISDAQAAKIDGFALNFAADQADRQVRVFYVHTSGVSLID
jgi:hypothetical protein